MALNFLKTGNKAIESNSDKLQNVIKTKGIIQSETDLTLDKFARIQALEKKIDIVSDMQSKIMDCMGLISGDTKSIVSAMLNMDKVFMENNKMIFEIAGNSKAIRSQIDSIANRKPAAIQSEAKPEVITRKPEAIKPAANQNLTPIQKAFKVFNDNFNLSYCKPDQNKLNEFQAFIDLIMEESETGIKKALSKYHELHGSFFTPRRNNSIFIPAIMKAINSVSDNDETEPEAIQKPEAKPATRKLNIGKEKVETENNSEKIKRSISYYTTNLVSDNEGDMVEVIKGIKNEIKEGSEKGAIVNLIYDELKGTYEIRKNTVSEFIGFFLENEKAISSYYAKFI